MSFQKNSKWLRILMIIAVMILMVQPVNTAYALDLDFSSLFGNAASQKEYNISTVSSELIHLGEEIELKAISDGLDKNKCQYAFYAKHETYQNWVTLSNYSKVDKFSWRPARVGNYSVCIKIKTGWFTVYKKYFDIKVLSNLKNKSYISTAEMPLGDTLKISGMSMEGSGDEEYAYYMQSADDPGWTELSGFSEAKQLTWKPQQSGKYSFCVKVKDNSGNLQEKYSDLVVYDRDIIRPINFDISVLSPISAPYQWSCSISDDSIIAVNKAVLASDDTDITSQGAYTYSVFDFRTVKAGQSIINLKYVSCNGEIYSLQYEIHVDKNLNLEVVSVKGNYFIKTLPEVNVKSSCYSISVEMPEDLKGSWQTEVSDSNITELISASKQNSGDTKYTFSAKREGKATVTVSYKPYGKTDPVYIIIYNIYIDENLNIYTNAVSGNYFDYENYPEIMKG